MWSFLIIALLPGTFPVWSRLAVIPTNCKLFTVVYYNSCYIKGNFDGYNLELYLYLISSDDNER